jgi:hypothetical protein
MIMVLLRRIMLSVPDTFRYRRTSRIDMIASFCLGCLLVRRCRKLCESTLIHSETPRADPFLRGTSAIIHVKAYSLIAIRDGLCAQRVPSY